MNYEDSENSEENEKEQLSDDNDDSENSEEDEENLLSMLKEDDKDESDDIINDNNKKEETSVETMAIIVYLHMSKFSRIMLQQELHAKNDLLSPPAKKKKKNFKRKLAPDDPSTMTSFLFKYKVLKSRSN